MTKSARKEIIKEMNRNAILNACEKLMILHPKGIDGVTMDDIAKEADFTKRTVYQYFQSKEEIHFAIMIRGHYGILDYLKKSMDDSQLGIVRLEAIGRALHQYSIDDPLHFWAVMAYENQESDFHVSQSLTDELYHVGEYSMSILMDTIRRGIDDGSIKSELNIKETAFAVWSFLLGMLNTAKTKKNYMAHVHGIDPSDWIDHSFELIMNTIRKGM